MNLRRTSAALSAGLLAGAGLTGLATSASAAPAGSTVVVNCVGKKVVKPKQIVIACADAGVAVTGITWKTWTANGATGTGTLSWNTCLPTDCASGTVETFPARIRLGRVASGPNVTAFSKMTLVFPKGGPALADTATYTLDNRLAD